MDCSSEGVADSDRDAKSVTVDEFVGVGSGGSVMVTVGDSMRLIVVVMVFVLVSSSDTLIDSVGEYDSSRVCVEVRVLGDLVTLRVAVCVSVSVMVSDPVLSC